MRTDKIQSSGMTRTDDARVGIRGEKMMRFLAVGVIALAFACTVQAESITIATFADPAADGTTPLFEFDATTRELSGGWSGDGLTLQTTAGTFEDVTFSMPTLPVDAFGGVGGGTLDFVSSGNALLFSVTFDSAFVTVIGLGATEFLATNDVVFGGSILPGPTENESFGFAFANQILTGPGGSFSATASFTASGEVIPEPATALLLMVGALASLRRRVARR
jgi:hypothetical protein